MVLLWLDKCESVKVKVPKSNKDEEIGQAKQRCLSTGNPICFETSPSAKLDKCFQCTSVNFDSIKEDETSKRHI